MAETPDSALTLLSVVRQWPIATNIASHLPAGSLINLARTSVSLRQALHAFDVPNSSGAPVTTDVRSRTTPDVATQDVRIRKMLQIGAHRTAYWEGLKRVAPFTCSSSTHTKGQKTEACLYCSMPTCESCIVKHSFGKNEHTFKNRCRFMCKRCWDLGKVQKERRYSGASTAANRRSHKLEAEARQLCTCMSKDGWVCNDCKEKQNKDAKVNGIKFCFGQDCENILEEDKDRRKICLWCNKPVPMGRGTLESRIAFAQKMIYAREREIISQMADFEEDESARHKQMRMSRREMRGDEAVKDDPDADAQQFIRNLDLFNYQRLCREQPSGQEIYDSKHGRWKYQPGFLACFRHRCVRHNDAALLKQITSDGSVDNQPLKTNMEIYIMRLGSGLDEENRAAGLSESFETEWNPDFSPQPDETNGADLAEEHRLDAGPDDQHLEQPMGRDEDGGSEYAISILQDDEVEEARRETGTQVGADQSNPGPEMAEGQPAELLPEYGADTLVLESGDAALSD